MPRRHKSSSQPTFRPSVLYAQVAMSGAYSSITLASDSRPSSRAPCGSRRHAGSERKAVY